MKFPQALCSITDERHDTSGTGGCWWSENNVTWSVYVVDGVAYTIAGTVGDVMDELEAA